MAAPGSITLFKDIFESSEPAKPAGRKYRDRKIECLINYYYYYGRKTGLKYHLLLEKVSNAFFNSPFTIHDIVQGNLSQLINLKNEWSKKDISSFRKHLQNKWPHLVWE